MSKPLKVLIVEDSEDDAALLLRILRRGGFDPVHARVEDSAGLRVALGDDSWDIVLSDHAMPHFNSFKALKIVKEEGSDIPFIVISGTVGEDVAVEVMKSGANDYLMKDKLIRLVPAIQRELQEAKSRRQRRQVEKELHDSQARLEDAQRIANLGHSIWDEKEGREVYRSREAARIFGIPQGKLTIDFDEFLDFVHPDDRKHVKALNEQSRRDHNNYSVEYQIIRPEGGVRHVREIAEFEFDEAGEHVRTISTIQDITQQRFTAEALRRAHDRLEQRVEERTSELQESERLLKQAAKIVGLGHYVWDELADCCSFVSVEYARILGLSVDEVFTKYNNHEKDIILVHPDDQKRVLATYAEFRKRGGSLDLEYRIIRPDGEERHIREMGDPVFDDQGQVIQNVGILLDITERAKVQMSLEVSEAKLKLATQTAKLGYWRFDEVVNEYLEVSEELAQIFGYTVEEYFDRFRHLEDDMGLVHPEDRAAVYEAYEAGIEAGIDYRIVRRDGSIAHVREISKHIEDDAGNIIEAIGTVQDISELKEAQLEAERANQAKTDFLSSMSHELRTPMNAILGFAQVLDIDCSEPLSEQQKSYVDHILQGGNHLMKLIDDVLELNKIEADKLSINFELIAADKIIDDSLQLIQTKAQQEGIQILDQIDRDELPILLTDGTRLTQVLLNLLSNAVKYNRVDGTVTLTCEETPGQMFRISVTDTGVGIPEEKQQYMFQPFERLGRETGEIEGTGIGLVVTKRLIELLGGEISYQSEEGKGSTFWIDVRISRTQAPAKKKPRASNKTTRKAEPRAKDYATRIILYIEDNRGNIQLMERIIAHLKNTTLVTALTAELGIDLATSKNPDLILMDINLPGINGIEALKQLQDTPRTKDIPVIAITAAIMPDEIEAGMKAGFSDYITKPINVPEFILKVEETLDRIGITIDSIKTN